MSRLSPKRDCSSKWVKDRKLRRKIPTCPRPRPAAGCFLNFSPNRKNASILCVWEPPTSALDFLLGSPSLSSSTKVHRAEASSTAIQHRLKAIPRLNKHLIFLPVTERARLAPPREPQLELDNFLRTLVFLQRCVSEIYLQQALVRAILLRFNPLGPRQDRRRCARQASPRPGMVS